MLTLDEIIWQLVASIPSGKVATYGQVAQLAGFPNHARYVGKTLKNLPNDSTLPWHRVVKAKGELAFAVGSEPYKKQKSLLEAEGVTFTGSKLAIAIFSWQ
ncbi:methylated-DNA--[protein]-cysteine S-methyltransferase [Pseudomonadota bacterium]|nr:methylated-DNA--[protein]-cysteine S-methyltransferase [Pseudomonadota bacterium]